MTAVPRDNMKAPAVRELPLGRRGGGGGLSHRDSSSAAAGADHTHFVENHL